MASTGSTMTAAQLLAASGVLGRCELVRGRLIARDYAGFEHGQIAANVGGLIAQHVVRHRLGVVTAAGTGYGIGRNPDTVRAPDLGFVRTERLPVIKAEGYFDGAPDLAVEVLLPADRAEDVIDKVQDWLAAGCGTVWVVDPETQTVTTYQPDQTSRVYGGGDAVSGVPVLPGLVVPLAQVFA